MFDIYGMTDIGCVRQFNEDFIHWQQLDSPRNQLILLADGMGGYAGGAMASQLAVKCFSQYLLGCYDLAMDQSSDLIASQMLAAGKLANAEVRRQRQQHPEFEKMGTTLLVMLVLGDEYWLMHVGDSRCYRQTSRSIQAMTRDHSLVQELLDKGDITWQEAQRAPFRNMLTRAVGPDETLHYSLSKYSMEKGDSWLLCSDGLYNTLSPNCISELMRLGLPAKGTAEILVQESLKRKASDNVSAIVVQPI